MAKEVEPPKICDIQHPLYLERLNDWVKWRLTFKGGDLFIKRYLQQYESESKQDFQKRLSMTYDPAFSKAAVVEVRNSIYQRLCDITRAGGTISYKEACDGKNGGVDMLGSSMNTFMGTEILEDLLVMGKVGVYVDMQKNVGETLAQITKEVHPYLYKYRAEDIRSWSDDDSPTPNQYKAVLLRDYIYERDPIYNLPIGLKAQYRLYLREDGVVSVQFFDQDGKAGSDKTALNLKRIPFICRELNSSLMEDIANYQIALLNLASSDLAYAIGANFPFYTEQFDPRSDPTHMKRPKEMAVDETSGGMVVAETGSSASQSIDVGTASGRKYAKGLDRPGFVHPSAEPMKVSMEKQEQMKLDIRLLINLSIANIQPKMASAESKNADVRTLESGLSYIGLILEDLEREAGEIWMDYEKSKEIVTIKYPEKYSLRNQAEIMAEVESLKKNMSSTPSITYKRLLAKRIAELLLGPKVPTEDLKKIFSEIDKAEVVDILIEKIEKDVEMGYLSHELAAQLRGYPKDDLEKANKEHVERIKAIQLAQTKDQGAGAAAVDPEKNPDGSIKNPGARGVGDISPDPKGDVNKEKDAAGNPVRGAVNKEISRQ